MTLQRWQLDTLVSPSHFATVTPANGSRDLKFVVQRISTWNDEAKARKLPTLLEGEALAIWLELSEEQKADYKGAKEQLIKKMAPTEFVYLEEFHSRKMWPGEAIALYLHDLK